MNMESNHYSPKAKPQQNKKWLGTNKQPLQH